MTYSSDRHLKTKPRGVAPLPQGEDTVGMNSQPHFFSDSLVPNADNF